MKLARKQSSLRDYDRQLHTARHHEPIECTVISMRLKSKGGSYSIKSKTWKVCFATTMKSLGGHTNWRQQLEVVSKVKHMKIVV